MPKCAVDGCDLGRVARGWCMTHYVRWRRTGTTDDRVTPTALERFWANVEKTDGCWLWTGSHRTGYGIIRIAGKYQPAHRYSYELHNGPISSDKVIDHICHNRGCVNPSHLRQCTQKQNTENRSGPQINNANGVRGVSRTENGKWAVRVGHNGKLRRYGTYSTLEQAEAVAIAVRNEMFTHNIEVA